jgi:hypothetical protein
MTVQESDQAHTKREGDERTSKQHPSPSHTTPSAAELVISLTNVAHQNLQFLQSFIGVRRRAWE